MSNANQKFLVLSWNTRGLGDYDKCIVVRDAIQAAAPSVACLQETKLNEISTFKAKTFLPPNLSNNYIFAPSDGVRGGIVTAWDRSCLSLLSSSHTPHSLTTTLQSNFYGPCSHGDKQAFLDELIELQSSLSGAWVVLGDFNLIRSPDDRSNGNFNHQEAAWFNDAIEAMALQELPLLDMQFTWSNR